MPGRGEQILQANGKGARRHEKGARAIIKPPNHLANIKDQAFHFLSLNLYAFLQHQLYVTSYLMSKLY